jgi:hypothetical protein
MTENDRSDYFAISGKGKLIFPQCNKCKNKLNIPHKSSCNAFLDGIPDDIYYNKHDHTKPYPGDNGIRFEPIK